jgi:hypothetical protein
MLPTLRDVKANGSVRDIRLGWTERRALLGVGRLISDRLGMQGSEATREGEESLTRGHCVVPQQQI